MSNRDEKQHVNNTTEQGSTETTSDSKQFDPKITEVEFITRKSPTEVEAPTHYRNKKTRPLTRKQRAFADYLIDNPKASATEAARHAYNVTKAESSTARTMAAENLAKPSIQAYMDIHGQQASNTMLTVMKYSEQYGQEGGKEGASYAAVAVSVAKDVLDRIHGKATQRTEVTSKSVSVNIDLTAG